MKRNILAIVRYKSGFGRPVDGRSGDVEVRERSLDNHKNPFDRNIQESRAAVKNKNLDSNLDDPTVQRIGSNTRS